SGKLCGMKSLLNALALLGLVSASASPAQDTIVIQELPSSVVADAEEQLDRIAALDDAGPRLNAVIAFNPDAARLAIGNTELPLGGRTVLVKDDMETREWPTTAGSRALKDNMAGRDAPLNARLREAGGVVLGKTNVAEWANIRS